MNCFVTFTKKTRTVINTLVPEKTTSSIFQESQSFIVISAARTVHEILQYTVVLK